jgi:hypothetical protein
MDRDLLAIAVSQIAFKRVRLEFDRGVNPMRACNRGEERPQFLERFLGDIEDLKEAGGKVADFRDTRDLNQTRGLVGQYGMGAYSCSCPHAK